MDTISIRYGESCTLPIDVGDETATSVDLYVGRPGEVYKFKVHAELTLGVGVLNFTYEDTTKLPVGKYNYQLNVFDVNNYLEKYPSPEEDCGTCEDNFPEYIVAEALDEQEVVS